MASVVKLVVVSSSDFTPQYATSGAAGMDICACEPTKILSGERKAVATGLIMQIPSGYYGRLASRSGNALRLGLDVCAGVIDSDYRGEIRVVLSVARGFPSVEITPGQKIAQLIIEPCARVAIEHVASVADMSATARGEGGFGSTGK